MIAVISTRISRWSGSRPHGAARADRVNWKSLSLVRQKSCRPPWRAGRRRSDGGRRLPPQRPKDSTAPRVFAGGHHRRALSQFASGDPRRL